MKHTIVISESQKGELEEIFNDPLLDDVGNREFSIETLRTMPWRNVQEIHLYCQSCGLSIVGTGSSRVVYAIDDETVIKVSLSAGNDQNENEVTNYRRMNKELKTFAIAILDYDKNHPKPLWIIAERVLTATYADFPKLLGFDFGSYESQADIDAMHYDLKQYSKYPGQKLTKNSLNLFNFLEDYADGNIKKYENIIKQNKWLNAIYKILVRGYANAWELEMIENWGLTLRNKKPRLIIIDLGI